MSLCAMGCSALPCTSPACPPAPRAGPARRDMARLAALRTVAVSRSRAPPPGSDRIQGRCACACTHLRARLFVSTVVFQLLVEAEEHERVLFSPNPFSACIFLVRRKNSLSPKPSHDTSVTCREKVEGERREAEIMREWGKSSRIPSITHMTC